MVPSMFNNVVLPPPELPRIMTNYPGIISNVTPRKAATPSTPNRYVLCKLFAFIIGSDSRTLDNFYIVIYFYMLISERKDYLTLNLKIKHNHQSSFLFRTKDTYMSIGNFIELLFVYHFLNNFFECIDWGVYLLNTSGGLIFKILCLVPSRLTRTPFLRAYRIIFLALSPS
jgi:hypothetical protein